MFYSIRLVGFPLWANVFSVFSLVGLCSGIFGLVGLCSGIFGLVGLCSGIFGLVSLCSVSSVWLGLCSGILGLVSLCSVSLVWLVCVLVSLVWLGLCFCCGPHFAVQNYCFFPTYASACNMLFNIFSKRRSFFFETIPTKSLFLSTLHHFVFVSLLLS